MAIGQTVVNKKEEAKKSAIDDIAFEDLFTPATEIKAGKGLKIGIYGRAKVGKSHFALTFPKGIIYVIDTEGAIKTNVQVLDDTFKSRIKVFEVMQYSSSLEEEGDMDFSETLKVLEKAIRKTIAANKGKEDVTLVVDSATDMWDWLSIWVTDEAEGVKHIAGGDKVNRLEWGKPNKRYTRMIDNLVRSGCNVIMTFRAKPMVDSQGCDVGVDTARWQKNTDYKLDLIVHMVKVGKERTLKFDGGRYGDNIPELKDPSWPKLLKHLETHSGVKIDH
jgi:hypothetical protein